MNEANLDTETVPKCSTLRIPGAHPDDTGDYELTLSNEAGADKVPVKITVMGQLFVTTCCYVCVRVCVCVYLCLFVFVRAHLCVF